MNNTPEWIVKIQVRENCATPGPYCRDGFNMAEVLKCVAERGSLEAKHTSGDYVKVATLHTPNWYADTIFFEHARTDIPALLEHCMVLREALEEAQKNIDACRPGSPNHIESNLHTVMLDIDKALLHKPEGVQ